MHNDETLRLQSCRRIDILINVNLRRSIENVQLCLTNDDSTCRCNVVVNLQLKNIKMFASN